MHQERGVRCVRLRITYKTVKVEETERSSSEGPRSDSVKDRVLTRASACVGNHAPHSMSIGAAVLRRGMTATDERVADCGWWIADYGLRFTRIMEP
jgi:hypothetical protein